MHRGRGRREEKGQASMHSGRRKDRPREALPGELLTAAVLVRKLMPSAPLHRLQERVCPQAGRAGGRSGRPAVPAAGLPGALLLGGIPAGSCWAGGLPICLCPAGLSAMPAMERDGWSRGHVQLFSWLTRKALTPNQLLMRRPCPQANYAAANCALDAWSHAWQAAGGASQSLQWGAWASSGGCRPCWSRAGGLPVSRHGARWTTCLLPQLREAHL